jgi:hypothetical protein
MAQTRVGKNNLKVSEKVEEKWEDPDRDSWKMYKIISESKK